MAARGGCRQLDGAMTRILTGLNVAQKAAVTSSSSVLQVLAPPGSGKTKTLTSRVAYLLAHEGYAPWDVICCTFTIKASREMRERLRGMIGQELESKLVLGTFHSICRRYLVAYGHLIGIPKNFGVADSDDSLNIIKRAVKRLKLSIDPKVARSRISHRKARGKRLDDLLQAASKNVDAQEFVTIFREYEDALALSNLLDYDDLLMRCVDLLKEYPRCVSNIEALLIDEFQDTNIVQFELMKLLASAKKRITIVGDPDQSIYGFRSAEIENLKRMKAVYPDTVVINLEENYRSASAVLKLAQQVIEQDNDRPQKKLKSTHRYGTLPVLRKLPNPHEEAQWIVSEIKRVTSMTGGLVHHGDIAILLRSAFLSLLIEKALASTGIPYRMVGGRRFFDRAEVRLVLDYLRTISHPDNTSALLAIINTPTRKIGDTTVKELVKVAEQRKESLWCVCNRVLNGQVTLEKKLAKAAEQSLNNLFTLIKNARKSMESMKPVEAPGKLIELVIAGLQYKEYIKKQYPEDHEDRWENVRELVTQASDTSLHFHAPDEELPIIEGVVQVQGNGAQEVLSRFLANVVLSTEVESNEEGELKPRVTISTIHSAKGLEWPVVFVPALYEGSIPHSRAEDTNEERRLLYVAMTRAQALLYMTFPITQSRDESESILSQFLPTSIKPLVSQRGPNLDDRVIGDVASILRRSIPSQEAIARAHVEMKETDSQYDNLWPEDGSHKRSFIRSDSDPLSFVLQKGQNLSDALKANSPANQWSHANRSRSYHASMNGPTTMDNASTFSASNTTTGFTKASDHLRSLPPKLPEESSRSSSTESRSQNMTHTSKKPRLTASVSGQGSIASFLNTGNARNENISQLPGSRNGHQGPPPSTTRIASVSEPCLPADLASHKLTYAASLLNRPSRPVLNNIKSGQLNCGEKRSYGFLSTSPTKPQYDIESIHVSGSVQGSCQHLKTQTTSAKLTAQSSGTMSDSNVSSSHGTPNLSYQNGSFQSSQLNRLTTLSPLNNMQGNIGGQGLGQARRTLGVRRTMNGWDTRKNK